MYKIFWHLNIYSNITSWSFTSSFIGFLFLLKLCCFTSLMAGYLRLGCMARDRGQIYEASDWFKEALQINQVSMIKN